VLVRKTSSRKKDMRNEINTKTGLMGQLKRKGRFYKKGEDARKGVLSFRRPSRGRMGRSDIATNRRNGKGGRCHSLTRQGARRGGGVIGQENQKDCKGGGFKKKQPLLYRGNMQDVVRHREEGIPLGGEQRPGGN